MQAIFDVISLASIMPLLLIINNRENLSIYIENLIQIVDKDFVIIQNDIALSFIVPLTVDFNNDYIYICKTLCSYKNSKIY